MGMYTKECSKVLSVVPLRAKVFEQIKINVPIEIKVHSSIKYCITLKPR